MAKPVILVVEAEPAVRQTAGDGLADAGFAVIEAVGADEAFALVADGAKIDLLFSDIVLPGGFDGIELARRAQALRPELPAILTSGGHGHVGPFQGVKALFLPKPYRLDHLVLAVSAVLERS
jgi:DNA-binding NtrC family response regulator